VHDVDLHGIFHAERPHDDVLVRERLDLFGRELAHLDVVVEQRVVFGELDELTGAEAIDPAVADMADVAGVADEEGHHDGGAHALELAVAGGGFVNAAVAELDAGDDAVFFVLAALVELVGPGDLVVFAGGAEELGEGLDRHLAGDFARGMAAHAIGDDEQVFFPEQPQAVLVVRPLHPNVGTAGGGQLHLGSTSVTQGRSAEVIAGRRGSPDVAPGPSGRSYVG
jgi:hypothetical protein